MFIAPIVTEGGKLLGKMLKLSSFKLKMLLSMIFYMFVR
jgi:hypothetical protein